jgi:hypothetical protein
MTAIPGSNLRFVTCCEFCYGNGRISRQYASRISPEPLQYKELDGSPPNPLMHDCSGGCVQAERQQQDYRETKLNGEQRSH